MNAFLCAALAVSVAAILAGCGGSNSADVPPEPSTVVQGVVFASDAFTSGEVVAYDYTSGAKGAQLARGSVGYKGRYELAIKGSPAAILVEADSGCYREFALGWDFVGKNRAGPPDNYISAAVNVCTTAPSLSAAVPFSAAPLTVAVTPYTHAAVGLAQYYQRAQGVSVATALSRANGRLSAWVGTNITSTLPAAPTRASTAFSAPVLYGSLLAGIPTWLVSELVFLPGATFGAGDMTSIAFANLIKNDLRHDGILNGLGQTQEGSPVALRIGQAALNTNFYRHHLAVAAVLRIRGETEGVKDATHAEAESITAFLPALSAYNDSTSELFDSSPVIPLDEGGAVIRISYPGAGAIQSNANGLSGFVYDLVGVRDGGTELLVDGVYYAYFNEQYSPSHFINTTRFPNGPHTLTIRVTNFLGRVTTASVVVTFLN